MSEYAQWDSKWAFIFAMIGVAIGLGNIWRFSYVVYSNGGGAFFIPYFVAIAIMGIPFLILEYGIGFSFKRSFSEILKKINPKFEFIAWILIFSISIVLMYYMVIISWDLFYIGSSLSFGWGSDTALYFVKNVGGTANIADFANFFIPIGICVIISWAILWFISHKSIDKGIGLASKILIPLVFIIMAIIVIFSLTLPGAGIGIDALINPNWAGLLDITLRPDFASLSMPQLFFLGFLLALAILGGLHFFITSYLDKIRVRQLYYTFILMTVYSVLLVFLQPQCYGMIIGMMIITVSPLYGHFIALTHTRLSNIVFIVIAAITLTLTGLNLWISSSHF